MEDLRQHHHQKQINSGLTRYQSAPSSYFSSFVDTDFSVGETFLTRPPSPETERIFEQFLRSTTDSAKEAEIKNEDEVPTSPPAAAKDYSNVPSQGFYQQQFQTQHPGPGSVSGMHYGSTGTNRLQTPAPSKLGGGANSNLVRHRSSPAGLFDTINIEKGYVVMSSTTNPPISEMRHQSNFGSSSDDSAVIPNNIPSSERLTSDRRTLSGGLNMSEIENVEAGNRPRLLAHHLSLPKSLSEMSEMEKLLQLSDSVPCRTRAKRGCATHPRSIAERVRRTKISERMKKLQDLVPNMDKQTNTADMLDLAVEYIKDLKKQVKTLSEDQENCTCSSTQ